MTYESFRIRMAGNGVGQGHVDLEHYLPALMAIQTLVKEVASFEKYHSGGDEEISVHVGQSASGSYDQALLILTHLPDFVAACDPEQIERALAMGASVTGIVLGFLEVAKNLFGSKPKSCKKITEEHVEYTDELGQSFKCDENAIDFYRSKQGERALKALSDLVQVISSEVETITLTHKDGRAIVLSADTMSLYRGQIGKGETFC